MSAGKVGPGVELLISELKLPEAEGRWVETVIENYGTPNSTSCLSSTGWVLYRIWNAIKGLFGCSDWQIAQNLIAKALPNTVTQISQDVKGAVLEAVGRIEDIHQEAADYLSAMSTIFETHVSLAQKGAEKSVAALQSSLTDVQHCLEHARQQVNTSFEHYMQRLGINDE